MAEVKDILQEYVATANNPQYKSDWNIINSKFPELKGYDAKLLQEYVATANNPQYKSNFQTINSKFPELFSQQQQAIQPKQTTTNGIGVLKKQLPFKAVTDFQQSIVDLAVPNKNTENNPIIGIGTPMEVVKPKTQTVYRSNTFKEEVPIKTSAYDVANAMSTEQLLYANNDVFKGVVSQANGDTGLDEFNQQSDKNNNIQAFNRESELYNVRVKTLKERAGNLERVLASKYQTPDFMQQVKSQMATVKQKSAQYDAYVQSRSKEVIALQTELEAIVEQGKTGAQPIEVLKPAYDAKKAQLDAIQRDDEQKRGEIEQLQNDFNGKLDDPDFALYSQIYDKINELSGEQQGLISKPEFAEYRKLLDEGDKAQAKKDAMKKAYQSKGILGKAVDIYTGIGMATNPAAYFLDNGEQVDKTFIGAKIADEGDKLLGRTVKALASISKMSENVNLIGDENKYDVFDKMFDQAVMFSKKRDILNPTATDVQRDIIQKYADVDGYRVMLDENGKPTNDVRDDKFRNINDKTKKEITDKYNENPTAYKTESDFSFSTLTTKATPTILDMGTMMATAMLSGGTTGLLAGAGTAGTVSTATTVGVSAAQMYGDMYESGLNAGLTPQEANDFATLTSIMTGMVTLVNPMEANIVKGTASKSIGKFISNSISKADVQLIRSGEMSIGQYAKRMAKEGTKNVFGENAEEIVFEPAVQRATETYYNTKAQKNGQQGFEDLNKPFFDTKQTIETAMITTMASLLMTPIEVANSVPEQRKIALQNALDNPQAFIDLRNSMLNDGDVSQEKFDYEVKAFEEISKQYNTVKPNIKEDLHDDLAELLLKKYTLKNTMSQVNDEVLNKKNQLLLDDINKRLEEVADGTYNKGKEKVLSNIANPNTLIEEDKIATYNGAEVTILDDLADGEVVINTNNPEIGEDGIITVEKSALTDVRNKPKDIEQLQITSAVININGKEYEGKNHAEAILKAQADGQDISQVDRQAEGLFKLSDGTIINREQAKEQFGQDRSELIIPQDEASNQANVEYKRIQDEQENPIAPIEPINARQELNNGTGIQQADGNGGEIQQGDGIGQVSGQEVPTEKVEEGVTPGLKDVESTAKALEGVDVKNIISPRKEGNQIIGFESGTKVYRAGGVGRYFTTDKQYIQEGGFKGETREFEIPKNSNLLDLRDDDFKGILDLATNEEKDVLRKPTAKYSKESKEQGDIVDSILRRNGYDGYIIKDAGDTKDYDTVVFRKDRSPDYTTQSISESYHKAKADGSNPELVKAVEDALKPTPEVSKPVSEVADNGEGNIGIEDNYNSQIEEKGFADVFIPDDLVINGVPKNTYKVRINKDGGIVYYDENGKEVGKNKRATKDDFILISKNVVDYFKPKEAVSKGTDGTGQGNAEGKSADVMPTNAWGSKEGIDNNFYTKNENGFAVKIPLDNVENVNIDGVDFHVSKVDGDWKVIEKNSGLEVSTGKLSNTKKSAIEDATYRINNNGGGNNIPTLSERAIKQFTDSNLKLIETPISKAETTEQKLKNDKHDRMVGLMREYNSTPTNKKTRKSEIRQSINKLASDLGYTVKGKIGDKIDVLNEKGKVIRKINIASDEVTVTPEVIEKTKELAQGWFEWNGNELDYHIDASQLGLTWQEIRRAKADIDAGKTESTNINRVANAINEYGNMESLPLVRGFGGNYERIDVTGEDLFWANKVNETTGLLSDYDNVSEGELRSLKELSESDEKEFEQYSDLYGKFTNEDGSINWEEALKYEQANGTTETTANESAERESGGNDISNSKNSQLEKEKGVNKTQNHQVYYNGKVVDMGYITNPKEQFKYASQRISDNLGTGGNTESVGYVKTPDGKIFEVSRSNKSAKLLSGDKLISAQDKFAPKDADLQSTAKSFTPIDKTAFEKLLDKLKKAFPNVKVELFGKGNMESAKKALEKYGVDLDLQSIYNIIGLSVLATSSTSQINQQPLITNAVSDNLNLSDGNVVEINDNRLIDKASGNKITDKNKMSASVTEGDIKKLTLLSNKHGVDPYTMIAMTMQETNFDTGLENPFHYDPQNWEKYKGISEDPMEIAVLVFKDKLKYAERLGKKTEAEKIQAYNGYGKIGKKTDAQKGSSVRSWYGISSSSFPIDMNKTPIYGNRVLDIRDNIIKSNPKIVKLVESQSNNIAFLKTKDGTIYGFKTPDGKVFINTDNLNANTPIHEYAHIWQSVFPNEFAKGIALLVQSPQGRELINEIRKNPAYKGKTITEIQAEALVTAIGNKGETIFNSNPTLFNKFKEWLSDFFKKIGDKLGIKDLSADDKLNMFTKKVVGELLGGKVLSKEVGKSNDVELQSVNNPSKEEIGKAYDKAQQYLETTDFNFDTDQRDAFIEEIKNNPALKAMFTTSQLEKIYEALPLNAVDKVKIKYKLLVYNLKANNSANKAGLKQQQKQMVADITALIKGNLGGITGKQAERLTNLATSAVEKNSTVRLGKIINQIANLADQRTYQKAKTLYEVIKARSKRKGGVQSGKLTGVLQDFATINPLDVSDIAKYVELAEKVKQASNVVKQPTDVDSDLVYDEVQAYVKAQQDEINSNAINDTLEDDAMTFFTVLDNKTKAKFGDDKTFDDLNELQQREVFASITKDDIKKYGLTDEERDMVEAFKEIKTEQKRQDFITATYVKIGELKDLLANSVGVITQSPAEKEITDALLNVKLDDMNATEMARVLKLINGITQNNDYSGGGAFVAQQKSVEVNSKMNTLKSEIGEFRKLSEGGSKFRNFQQISVAMAKGKKLGAKLMEASGINNLMRSIAKTKTYSHNLQKAFKAEKFKSSVFEPISQMRQSIYAAVIQTKIGDDVKEAEHIERWKRIIEKNIENLRTINKDGYKEQAELLQKALDEVIGDRQQLKDIADNMSKVDSEGKRVVQFFTDNHAEQKPRFRENSLLFHNKEIEEYNSYTKLSITSLTGDTVRDTGEKLMNDARSTGITKKKSKSMIDRANYESLNDNTGLDFNFINKQMKALGDNEYDINTSADITTLANAFNSDNKQLRELLGAENFDLLKKKLQTIVGTSKYEETTIVDDVINEATKISRVIALGSITQALKQATVLLSTYINSAGTDNLRGVDFKLITGTQREKDNLHKLMAQSEIGARRAESAGGFYDNTSIKKNISDGFAKKTAKYFGRGKDFASNVSMGLLRWADIKAADLSWVTFYKKYLRDNNLTFDENNEFKNPNKDAMAYAETMVQTAQGANTEAGQADLWNMAKGITQMVFPFMSFAIQGKARLVDNLMNIANGDDRVEALRDTAGYIGEQLAFNKIKLLIGIAVTQQLLPLLLEALELGDDDDDRLNKEQKENKKLVEGIRKEKQTNANFWNNIIKDLTYGTAPLIDNNLTIPLINGIVNWRKAPYDLLTKGELNKTSNLGLIPEYKSNDFNILSGGTIGVGVNQIKNLITDFNMITDRSVFGDSETESQVSIFRYKGEEYEIVHNGKYTRTDMFFNNVEGRRDAKNIEIPNDVIKAFVESPSDFKLVKEVRKRGGSNDNDLKLNLTEEQKAYAIFMAIVGVASFAGINETTLNTVNNKVRGEMKKQVIKK